ncbi:MAG: hypothetical protein AMJ46_12735 [Latescibacteria bacterium DG_63]|nr:MAG: hypothetical protein AMJ46_12735 [Latescibacteria bacterium DG_63]
MRTEWRVSSEKITAWVATDNRRIVHDTAPVLQRFVGQPLDKLCRWMRQQGVFRLDSLTDTTQLDGLRYRYEERAAIKEYCGGMTRAQAEDEAWEEIMSKGSNRRPRDDKHCTKEQESENWACTFGEPIEIVELDDDEIPDDDRTLPTRQ